MGADSETTKGSPGLTVETYKPTKYSDTGWPVVGTFENNNSFVPMEFQRVTKEELASDPMFSDFGGRLGDAKSRRHGQGKSSTYSPTRRLTEDDIAQEVERRLQASLQEHAAQVEAARLQAFEEGSAAGLLKAEEQQRQIEQRYIEVIEDIGAQLNESIGTIESRALDLALEISNKLVGSIVDVNPEYIIEIIKEAIALAGGVKIKSIKVSQQDLEFLRLLNPAKEFKEFDGAWDFEGDEGIRSGCIVEMVGGVVDYQLDKAWERIKEQVVKVRS